MKQVYFGNSAVVDYEGFLRSADLELKRAERYRIFVSLVVLDLSLLQASYPTTAHAILAELTAVASKQLRCTDMLTLDDQCRMILLFPETPRQSAMTAAQRISEFVRAELSMRFGRTVDEVLPLDMVSFPDAAGAKPVKAFLDELAHKSQN